MHYDLGQVFLMEKVLPGLPELVVLDELDFGPNEHLFEIDVPILNGVLLETFIVFLAMRTVSDVVVFWQSGNLLQERFG